MGDQVDNIMCLLKLSVVDEKKYETLTTNFKNYLINRSSVIDDRARINQLRQEEERLLHFS